MRGNIMSFRKINDLQPSEVTPREVFQARRRFMQLAAGLSAGALLPGAALAGEKLSEVRASAYTLPDKLTPLEDIAGYNNFYEFGTDKSDPAKNAQKFQTSPWTVSVEGEVKTPRKFTMDEILKLAPLEERIYRHRCVERWSIVVPWIGFSFNVLAKLVEPTPKARYVAFQTFYDSRQMPQAKYAGIDLPYVEGLRLDEAMNPLALLCVGMYGETLPNQDGAPVRMVIPWKYGYKSIKSLIKIRFQEKEPPTTWGRYSSDEYGFYSNVNPNVDHPRWSQAKERRLGEIFMRNTLMFNGYSDQVASLYNGMDLKKYH
jgi:methionine sulfoxide reductase catalytic subunit